LVNRAVNRDFGGFVGGLQVGRPFRLAECLILLPGSSFISLYEKGS
jgi:hypothetical protein